MRKIILYGIHAVNNLLQTHPESILRLSLDKSRDDQRMLSIIQSAEALGVGIQWQTRQQLDQLCEGEQHQGCVAECRLAKPGGDKELQQHLDQLERVPLLLILDQVQDPHNLGACLRSAEAAGVDAVIAPKDRSAPLTPTVFKSSAGAALRVAFFQVTNLARTQQMLQQRGIWIVGTQADAEKTLYQLDLSGPLALVMGSEGKGMRRLVEQHCDFLAALPLKGQVSSLNVSVTTGICLYEALRQREKL